MDSTIEDLIKELESNPNAIDKMSEEELCEIEKKLNPYGTTIYGDEKYTCLSFTNLREKYMTKLLTTGLIGFTYQMCKEHSVDEDDMNVKLNVNDYLTIKEHPDKHNSDITSKVFNQVFNEYMLREKKENLEKEGEVGEECKDGADKESEEEWDLEAKATQYANDYVQKCFKDVEYIDLDLMESDKLKLCSKQTEEEKKVIERFLNKLFKFDPNTHAVNSFTKSMQVGDPERVFSKTEDIYNNVPNDTYNRFQMYYDVNYDKLREAVMYLYNEKPDIEVALNVYDSFSSLEECNDFVEKNKNKVITSIYTLTNNKWNLLGSFKQNRERLNFYNKNTTILENIIKQQEADAKTGKELLSKRVKKMKTKNVKRYGKDHPNFIKYKQQNLDGVYDSAITKITEDVDGIVVESEVEISDTGSKIDSDGVPEDALEIKVTSINAASQEVKQSTIYTKAQEPDTK